MKELIKTQEIVTGFSKIAANVDNTLRKHNLDHRLVGGILPDLLNLNVIRTAQIDPVERKLFLPDHINPTLLRNDGTVKDLDVITFSPNINSHQSALMEIAKKEKQAKSQGHPYPFVALERTRYSGQAKINQLSEFVSSFVVDENNQLHLKYDSISEPITKKSVEEWTVQLRDGTTLTMFNPCAHVLRYPMRGPAGVKKKDKIPIPDPLAPYGYTNKISLLMTLSARVQEEGLKYGIDYNSEEYYAPWKRFILNLLKHPNANIKAKGFIAKLYWDTFGTALAHGKGVFKPLSRFSTKFTG